MKNIIHHDQVSFIPGKPEWFNILLSFSLKASRDKKHVILSTNAEKAFNKIQHPFMIKALKKQGIEGRVLNVIKAIYSKPIANIMLNGKQPFPLMPTFLTPIQYSFEIPN
jgi:nitrate reductase beta subunit